MTSINLGPSSSTHADNTAASYPRIITVSNSRALTDTDDGCWLECSTSLTLTIPPTLKFGVGVVVIPSGTITVAAGNGVLINGLTTSVTRTAANNFWFGIQGRRSVPTSYVVNGS